MEYDYALSKEIPFLAFIKKGESVIDHKESKEAQYKLEKFIEKASTRMSNFWENRHELSSVVSTSLVKMMKDKPRIGWVRNDDNDTQGINAQNVYDYIVFPRHSRHNLNNRLEEVIVSNLTASMKIICYGTNKYGRIIEDVITNLHNINLEVIVCSPFVNMFGNNIDKNRMFENINDMLKADNISVMISEIPPTIRAAAVYDDAGVPIWCSMQPYYIFKGERLMLRGEAYAPAIVNDKNNNLVLTDMVHYFEMEFSRLKKHSKEIDTKTMEEYYDIHSAEFEHDNV